MHSTFQDMRKDTSPHTCSGKYFPSRLTWGSNPVSLRGTRNYRNFCLSCRRVSFLCHYNTRSFIYLFLKPLLVFRKIMAKSFLYSKTSRNFLFQKWTSATAWVGYFCNFESFDRVNLCSPNLCGWCVGDVLMRCVDVDVCMCCWLCWCVSYCPYSLMLVCWCAYALMTVLMCRCAHTRSNVFFVLRSKCTSETEFRIILTRSIRIWWRDSSSVLTPSFERFIIKSGVTHNPVSRFSFFSRFTRFFDRFFDWQSSPLALARFASLWTWLPKQVCHTKWVTFLKSE
jgi:hypothetical protein